MSPTNADTGNTGIPDGYKQDSAGDGYNNLQKFQMNIPPGTWVAPPTPTSFTAVLNTDGSTTLSWNSSPGSVTGYIIQRADPDPNGDGGDGDLTSFETIATLSPTDLAYTDNSGTFTVGDPLATYGQGSVYRVQAVYAGGNSGFAALPMLGDVVNPAYAVNAKLVRGGDGRYLLAFSALATNIQNIRISWQGYDYGYDLFDGTIDTQTIAVSNLINGRYPVPDDVITNYLAWNLDIGDRYMYYAGEGYYAWVQGVGANGQAGPLVQAGVVSYDAPYWMDCRQHLQDSLNFLLESATLTQLYPPLAGAFPEGWLTLTNNFVEVGLYHTLLTSKWYGDGVHYPTPIPALDNTWPLILDYTLAQFLYSTNTLPYFGWGQYFAPPSPFPIWPYYLTTPDDVLLPNGTFQTGPYGIQQDAGNLADVGAATSDGGTNVSLASGIHNIFGLAVTNAVCIGGPDPNYGYTTDPTTGLPVFWDEDRSLSPGGSVAFNFGPLSSYYSQFQAPRFEILSYYFAPVNFKGPGVVGLISPVQPFPLPLTADFALTNTTPFVIASVGQPMVIGGWAKQVLTNGAAGVYAYLGQYFETNAFKIGTNGAVTTNTTGIVSPYGEFLPTEPGPTALKTMPDLTTGQQGTDVVNVIKMQLDVNHDGIMDLTFAGPDNTSTNRPYKFWINNDHDTYNSGPSFSDLGHDAWSPETPDFADNTINSMRDLEDFARLWIVGMPPLWASNGYQVKLYWTNVVSGNPAINLFPAFETNGGTGYLTDTNVAAGQLGWTYSGVGLDPNFALATISVGPVLGHQMYYGAYTFPANFFTNGATKYFLFEGAGVGQGELVLNITQNGTNVASTSVFMNLMDVKDMFEHAHIENQPIAPPSATLTDQSTFRQDNNVPVDAGDGSNLVVFVHGWRVTTWVAENFAQTMFKRLYWQGYQGRYAALRWPTLSGDTDGPVAQFLTFNRDEYIAFNCAQGTANYFVALKNRFPNYSVNVCAHSHGNVLMMETLRRHLASGQTPIHNYALLQAAVAAECLDTNAPLFPGFIVDLTPLPDSFRGYAGPLQNALSAQNGVAGHMVNFYNTNDFGVVTCWQPDQLLYKPDGRYGYLYVTNTPYQASIGSAREITDPHELMAFLSRPQTQAVGAVPNLAGSLATSREVDLQAVVGFTSDWQEHSGEFNWPIQRLQPFYQALVDQILQ